MTALAVEQLLLGFLIRTSSPPDVVRSVLELLKTYQFQSVEHQVVFECIAGLRRRTTGEFLNLLPTQMVRAGFPDIDLERFLGTDPIGVEQALTYCRVLAVK